MSVFSTMQIAASGLTAERARMDVIAENVANANTTRGADGEPYRRKQVVLQEVPMAFQRALSNASQARSGAPSRLGGVEVAAVQADGQPGQRVYDPQHPDADAQGYVTMPNVNPVTEMTDLIVASRAYEANVTVLNTAKSSFVKTLDILR